MPEFYVNRPTQEAYDADRRKLEKRIADLESRLARLAAGQGVTVTNVGGNVATGAPFPDVPTAILKGVGGKIVAAIPQVDYERFLGNPASDGQFLASTAAGDRYWTSTAGGAAAPTFRLFLAAALTPTGTGADTGVYSLPNVDGASATFNVIGIGLIVRVAGSLDTEITIDRSSDVGGTWSTVGTLTLPAGDNTVYDSSSLGTVDSGDWLRFSTTTLGDARDWTPFVDLQMAV